MSAVSDAIHPIETGLRPYADAERAQRAARYFRAVPGGYGEGDRFIGVSVPDSRRVARAFRDLSRESIREALRSPWHEVRMTALFVLVHRFERAGEEDRRTIADLYFLERRGINNWDLVDSSAPPILGGRFLDGDEGILDRYDTGALWDTRIAILATFACIRQNRFDPTITLCERYRDYPHDLIHKACGWMLREVGARDIDLLREFLRIHAAGMPRTMLRYAIEKMDPEERRRWRNAGD